MRILLSKKTLLSKALLQYGLAAFVGWIFGEILLALLVVSVFQLAWQYKHIFLLDKWLWRDRKLTPPAGDGSWQQIFDGIYFQQRRERRKRKELRTLVRRFRDGAEALPEAVVVLSEDWSIIWCNKLAQILMGLRWPSDEGQRIDNLIRSPEFHQYLKEQRFQQPLEVLSPTSSNLVLECKMMPYGKAQFLLIVRDISQLKQLEQIRKDFVANVSHELRTPLTVLQGYLEMMDADCQPPPAIWPKAHTVMLEQTRRMDSLVQQLLTLSRIEAAARVQFELEVDVPAMLHLIEHEAETLNREKQHQLHFNIDDSLKVTGVSEELRSAFSNLVTNAIKYTPANGIIHISWQREHQKALFTVTDNGEGIAANHVKRLTERFYRVDQARARHTGGTGLGLAIVKHVLSRHNSQLMIFSEPGEGSTFSFALPPELVLNVQSSKRLSKPN
ncbi:phosphate regulon sensor histidine kinase PhoR [Alishewanella sp. SMS8]|uniref:phosphate regulon sensor histidine kinase PhoR n=1 Tax=Alishewanella sp. SMS8 TaxID=2994676 RepID=UPI0027421B0E|nr:phosphate regulon sensor histidine kinase PhoR [Alishewanella sp. SMS8]MDP5206698.1 phosphate regulon sensor histidine kinase PhoR [Alishewanella sp. SMS9]MDP5458745.1 phosphate regulon sensor histidine kinase PhoR [Alishewanella sp. SMS8]